MSKLKSLVMIVLPILLVIAVYNFAKSRNLFGVGEKLP